MNWFRVNIQCAPNEGRCLPAGLSALILQMPLLPDGRFDFLAHKVHPSKSIVLKSDGTARRRIGSIKDVDHALHMEIFAYDNELRQIIKIISATFAENKPIFLRICGVMVICDCTILMPFLIN